MGLDGVVEILPDFDSTLAGNGIDELIHRQCPGDQPCAPCLCHISVVLRVAGSIGGHGVAGDEFLNQQNVRDVYVGGVHQEGDLFLAVVGILPQSYGLSLLA